MNAHKTHVLILKTILMAARLNEWPIQSRCNNKIRLEWLVYVEEISLPVSIHRLRVMTKSDDKLFDVSLS